MKHKLMTIKEIEKHCKNLEWEAEETPTFFLSREEIKDLCFYQHTILAKMQRIKGEKSATRSLKIYYKDWEENIEKLNNLLDHYKILIKVIERNISGRMNWNETAKEVEEEINALYLK